MKKSFIDNKTGIRYDLQGDYYIPDIVLKAEVQVHLNKYGLLRLEYLKNYKKGEYTFLLLENKLIEHIAQVQNTAKKRVADIVNKLKIEYGITEEMKHHNQMEWVGQMNSIKNQAEEIVLNELIYT